MTSAQTSKPSTKSPKPQPSNPTPPPRSSSLPAHLAMIELKQRILTSISKLSDRDTHQIAVEDLEKIAQTLTSDGIPMFLNCLYESLNDPKPAVKKESLRFLAFLCSIHGDLTYSHLPKIISHIIKRLKDADSVVKDACRDAIGSLSGQYVRGTGGDQGGGVAVVGLFAKPLFEAMNEQNKGVQAGAALCMARMMESATDPPVSAFQKLCPRISKLLHNQNFLAKSALLPVVASLSQVGALAPQNLESLLPSIHECLGSPDWATRKAAADALTAIGQNSSHLITTAGGDVTLTVLESCRFDKIKPVRDSMTEALQLWKKIAGKKDIGRDEQKTSCADSEPADDNGQIKHSGESQSVSAGKNSLNGSSQTSDSKANTASILDKAARILKKKPPTLSDNEINPEFFQKLETRVTDDLPVEVIAPPRLQTALKNEEDVDPSNADSRIKSNRTQPDDPNVSYNIRNRSIERGGTQFSRQRDHGDSNFALDRVDLGHRDSSGRVFGSKSDGQSESSFMNNKGNWSAIQRQLHQLERQQSHLMNMLQEFMGGSHNNMVTLENRVRGLERIVEDMAHDLSISSGRRSNNYLGGYDGSSNRHGNKYSGFSDYSSSKFGRAGDGRIPYGERYAATGRGSSWRSDVTEPCDFNSYSRNGLINSRKAGASSMGVRSPKSDHSNDQISNRRAWERGTGPFGLGEGPSARSVWQASKDEATLEAIRVAGEDNGKTRTARVAIPELVAEAMGDENGMQERDPIWTCWTNAMDALHVGDFDTAFAEVLSTGDDQLLVKLLENSGPVIDQLTNEVACEVLHAVGQFLLEQNLLDICLSWTQQLADIIIDHGPDSIPIPDEVKRELLLNLNEVAATVELPEDWEGAAPDQLLEQLASAWEMDLPPIDK